MATRMQQTRALRATFSAKNYLLLAGEIGFEKDTGKIKIGDGVTTWNSLPYLTVEPGDINGFVDAGGKINTSFLPALAIGDTKIVETEAAKLALTTNDVQKGDVVIVTGTNKTYRVIDDTKLNQEGGYAQILTPDAPVQSVNSKTGVVSLDTDDVSEGSSNLYYTQTRFDNAFAAATSASLSDGANILHTSSIIDGGEITND